MDGYQPGPSGSGEIVLDLSTRKKPEDTNNNIKTEQGTREGERSGEEGSLRSRKYSELSECSAGSEVPGSQETPETSTSTAPVCSPSLGETSASSVTNNKRANPSPPMGPDPKKPASGMLEEH